MLTRELEETLSYAVDEAVKYKHEYVTLEHLLFALLEDTAARDILYNCGAQIEELAKALEDYFADVLEKMPAKVKQMPELTSTFQATIQYAILQAEGSGTESGQRRQYPRRDFSSRTVLCGLSAETAGHIETRYFKLHRARHLEN
jgi:ATP-dependent Clp protease ATP-binding subunit ClpA